MDRSARRSRSLTRSLASPALVVLAWLAAPAATALAGAQPGVAPVSPAAEARPFTAQLDALRGVPGGLTAEQVALRAEETSFDVAARRHEIAAAASEVDRALVAYLPRLALSASYARYSSVDQPAIGNVVAAPGVPPGPLPAGAALVAGPVVFPDVVDSSRFQAGVSVPLSDYLAVLPGRGVLCVWSPALDVHGNSVAGVEALDRFTTRTGWSIF